MAPYQHSWPPINENMKDGLTVVWQKPERICRKGNDIAPVESRASSPLRIPRNAAIWMNTQVQACFQLGKARTMQLKSFSIFLEIV